MAESITARLSLDDVRASVKRARKEGERFVNRLRKDTRELLKKSPRELVADARKRVEGLAKDLDEQRATLVKNATTQLTRLADELRKRVGAASAHDVDALTRRVAELERRLEHLTKKSVAAA
jgi:ubiquinone biosynthesis protein UbiJ